MTNILIVSDSHGRKNFLEDLINSKNHDYIFYLGDGADRDIGTNIYDPSFIYVKGNCDNYYSDFPLTQTLNIEGLKILITHGHEQKVKYGLEYMLNFAKSKGYKLVCFGHTHKQVFMEKDGIIFINPGALKNGDYAELMLDNKTIDCKLLNMLN